MKSVYKEIVEDILEIGDEFFEQHESTIKKRFILAGSSETNQSYFDSSDIFGLNQCIHLANSIVLLGSKGQNSIKNASELIRTSTHREKGPDITTVLTIATLYYLILRMEEKMDEKDLLKKIRSRFDETNWLIGPDLMKYLGIETLANQTC